MMWRLDPPIRVGARVFAALTTVEITAHQSGEVVMGSGAKRPVAVLVQAGGEVMAIGLDGKILSAEDTLRGFPDAVAEFRSRAERLP